jgi:hypothetical protein
MKKICKYCEAHYETNHPKSFFCSRKCRFEYNRKNKVKEGNKTLKWAKKLKAIELLGSKCKICGDNNIFHFVFHHNDMEDKEYIISQNWDKQWSVIEKEIKKCTLLCDNCHRELHYNNNETEKRRNTKELIVNYRGNKCEICGYNKCLSALTFHHTNKDDKEYSIGKISLIITDIQELTDDIFKELNKCEMLCSNCHREKHVDINDADLKKINIKKGNYKEKQKKLDKCEIFKLYFDDNLKNIEISRLLKCSKSTISEIIKEEKNKRLIGE